MLETLLSTKLFVPSLRPSLIQRSHLVAKLNAGFHGKLILVSAPPGFGKTTLVTSWLHQCNRPFTWLSLDKEDNDPNQFIIYLVAALQKIDEGLGQTTISLLQTSQHPPLDTLLTLVINDLAASSKPAILVLDDYHVIDNLEIHKALAFFLDKLPPRLLLVLASREDPPLPLHRLRSSGQMNGIYADDLRFSRDEAAAFLRQTMKMDLAPEDMSSLVKRTEGWIAGLQLAALSLQGLPDTHAFVAGFAGDDRYIADYLLHEVIERQPDHIREFLWKTAILNRFCPALCDAILETPPNQSIKIITYLEESNLFIIPLDNKREWYRYHHLFADFLRLQARNDFSDEIVLVHQRAASWYEGEGLLVEAIENALTGKDYDRASRLIAQNRMEAIFGHSHWTKFLNWMRSLPPEMIRSKPQLNLHFAWALFSTGQWLDAEPYLKEVETVISESKGTADYQWMLGEVTTIRALVSYEMGDLERSKEMAAMAHKLLPKANKMIRSVAFLAEGMAHMWGNDDVQTKHQHLRKAFDVAREAGNMTVSLFALGCMTMLEVRGGRLKQAARLYQQTRTLGTIADKVLLGPAGVACVQMGAVLHEWDRLEEAEDVLWEGIKLCQQQQGMPVWIIEGYVNLARLKVATGNEEQADKLMQQAESLLAELPGYGLTVQHLLSATHSYRLRYWLAIGKLDLAAQWLARNRISVDSVVSPENAINNLLLARIFLEQGQLENTRSVLQRVEEIVAACESPRVSLELLIIRALCLQAQGEREQAVEGLSSSLRLAEPEGYTRLFVDYGESMARLLQMTAPQSSTPTYADRLLSTFVKLPTPSSPESSAALVESLNDRDLQVLKLMAAGLSNRQISDELYLSVNTIKAYTSRIYGKLGVSGRAEAIDQAHRLGLL